MVFVEDESSSEWLVNFLNELTHEEVSTLGNAVNFWADVKKKFNHCNQWARSIGVRLAAGAVAPLHPLGWRLGEGSHFDSQGEPHA